MALSEDLKQVYSNYDDTRMFYDTVQLYHPNFNVTQDLPYPSEINYPSVSNYPHAIDYVAQSFFLIRNDTDKSLKIEDGTFQNFVSYPFDIIQPEVGEDQQDLGIVLDNVSLEIIGSIELASQNTSTPIVMKFRVYVDGLDESQITPITLNLTEVVVDMTTVTCKASRIDLYQRKFPFGENTYYDSKFKGLVI